MLNYISHSSCLQCSHRYGCWSLVPNFPSEIRHLCRPIPCTRSINRLCFLRCRPLVPNSPTELATHLQRRMDGEQSASSRLERHSLTRPWPFGGYKDATCQIWSKSEQNCGTLAVHKEQKTKKQTDTQTWFYIYKIISHSQSIKMQHVKFRSKLWHTEQRNRQTHTQTYLVIYIYIYTYTYTYTYIFIHQQLVESNKKKKKP